MKRLFSLLTVLVLLLLCACGNNTQPTEPPVTDAPTDITDSTDGSANTSETEVPTEAAEPLSEVRYSSARIYRDDTGEVWVQAIIEIRNIGDDMLYCGDATVDITADGKTSVQLRSVRAYPQIIAPGESAYYYEEALVDTDYSGEVSVVLEYAEVPATVPRVSYRVEGALSDSVYGGVKLSGTVENTSDSTADMVCVGAVLFDDRGTPIGLVYDYLTEPLKVGATTEYAFESDTLPSEITAQSVADTKIFAFPLQAQ